MANTYYPVTQPIKLYTDSNGAPLQGGYIYYGVAAQNPEVNPITMFWDAAGTIPAAQPIRTTNGYISRSGTPANIYAPGDFSITVRDKNGSLLFTLPHSPDIELAESVTGGAIAADISLQDAGNYYPGNDNVEAALQVLGPLIAQMVTALGGTAPTGARIGYVGTTAPAGWVLADGATIGSAASNATGRANADTQSLYTLLWNSYANAQLAIQDSSGSASTRGVSAAIDFAANKRLPVPDYSGRTAAGTDNMSGTARNKLTAASGFAVPGVMGDVGSGTETYVLTHDQIPAHTHVATDAGHTHVFTGTPHTHTYNNPTAALTNIAGGGNQCITTNPSASTGSTTAGGTNATGNASVTNASNTPNGAAHLNVQPTITESVIIKL